jgi:glucoamylase
VSEADLEAWTHRQYRRSSERMMAAISATALCKSRFGRAVRAAPGSVVASPVLGAYDPDPDYFFHWYRDAAVVVDALRLLHEPGRESAPLARFREWLRFELALARLDGRTVGFDWRAGEPRLAPFARDDAELALVYGAAVASETRVSPDGTLDLLRWPRPQHDGPALRALTLLRWQRTAGLEPALQRDVERLLRADLAFVRSHWHVPCYDMWEEELGLHYYVLCVCAAALEAGADWLAAHGEVPTAERDRAQACEIRRQLDGYWLPESGYYRSRVLTDGRASTKELDIAVIFGAIHAGAESHGPGDERVLATLARLEQLFDRRYGINHNRPSSTAPAMGRYADDVYYSGGAYYFSTLAAAELCFRASIECVGQPSARDWLAHGDAFLATVRRFTPDDGALSEQFDRDSGAQTSAPHLTWSYAAFITAAGARSRARARLGVS